MLRAASKPDQRRNREFIFRNRPIFRERRDPLLSRLRQHHEAYHRSRLDQIAIVMKMRAAKAGAITMTSTPPKRPTQDYKPQSDAAIRRMLATATGCAQRVKPDPHRVDSEGRYRAKAIHDAGDAVGC
jgi:hypothetical protein